MKKRGHNKGFTIVELMVVIIIVAILATLVALSYGSAQIQARDTQMRDAADKFADAIKLMQIKKGSFPLGGSGSTVVATSTGCADGANGWQAGGYYAKTNNASYRCTLGDAAVAMGYLPDTFFDNLPFNTAYGSSTNNAATFMVYTCGTKKYLFYSMEKPTTEESASLNNLIAAPTSCVNAGTAKNTYGMRAVKDLSAF